MRGDKRNENPAFAVAIYMGPTVKSEPSGQELLRQSNSCSLQHRVTEIQT
jgi:hypothetical protein